MSNEPVTVLIPCRNKANFLKRTLTNLMAQMQFDQGDEIIVLDNGSTDHLKMVIDEFVPPVQVHPVPSEGAWMLNTVRNTGIKEAANDLIILFDADTVPQPECVDRLRAAAGKGKYVSGLVYYTVPFSIQEKMAKKHGGRAPGFALMRNYDVDQIVEALSDPEKTRGTFGVNCIFHKDDAYQVGLFDEDYNGGWGYGETDFILKLHYNGIEMVHLKKWNPMEGGCVVEHLEPELRKSVKNRRLKEANRNRLILLNKIGAYKDRIFPETPEQYRRTT